MSTPRNAPCPCGSGLKAKRCCIPVAMQATIDQKRARRESFESHIATFRDKQSNGILPLFFRLNALLYYPSRPPLRPRD